MLFEEFIQQHRVYLLVADRFRLALGIASHEIGIHLGHFLSNQAKGKRLRGVILLVVAEAHWFERIERFTGFLHRLDVAFIPARRDVTPAKSSAHGYGNRVRIRPNNGLHVGVDVADKAMVTHVRAFHVRADTDDVTCCGNVAAGSLAQGYVVVAAGVEIERNAPKGRVFVAGGVATERSIADSRVAEAFCVAIERTLTDGRVEGAGGVV